MLKYIIYLFIWFIYPFVKILILKQYLAVIYESTLDFDIDLTAFGDLNTEESIVTPCNVNASGFTLECFSSYKTAKSASIMN